MKNFAKGAFNVCATVAGSAGTLLGGIWTAAEATGFPNGTAFVRPDSLLQAAFFTAASATVLALGYKRFFFSGKTSQFLRKLTQSNNHGPQ